MVGVVALDRQRPRGGEAADDADDDRGAGTFVPYKGPIAPPSTYRPLRLLPDEAHASSRKAVVYDDGQQQQQQQQQHVHGKPDDRRLRAFSPTSPLSGGSGGGIGESPRVRVAGSSTSSSAGGFPRRRDGSGSSYSDSAGRASFSRTARELFPFISSPPPASRSGAGAVLHAVRSTPGLSPGSTPTTDSFASSTSDYEPTATGRTSSGSSRALGRQRSNSTSNVGGASRPSADLLPWSQPVPPLVRSRSGVSQRGRRGGPSRKISEPFLTPGEPVEAETFVPTRPVPAPSPEKQLRGPSSRGIPPYLRADHRDTGPASDGVARNATRRATAVTSSVPRGSGSKRQSTMYEASTFCDTVVFPQPKLKPFLITPPPTPRSSTSPSVASDAVVDHSDPDLEPISSRTSEAAGDEAARRLTFEELVRREGETREHERAAWARAATKQAAVTRSFDVKRQRRRSKSLTHLRGSAEGRFSFDAEGPNGRPIARALESPDMPSSFAFLRPGEPRLRKGSFDERGRAAELGEPRSPLRSAMRLIRRTSSLGNLSEKSRPEPAPQLPHVRIVESLHAGQQQQQQQRQSTFAGRTPPAGLRLLPPEAASSSSERSVFDADGPVIDISRPVDGDSEDYGPMPWGSARRSENRQSELAEVLDASAADDVGIALSPVAATFDLTTTATSAASMAGRDRHRHASSRSGSVTSIQAFHRRFPSTASSSSAVPAPRPASNDLVRPRAAWQNHSAGHSLDSASHLQAGSKAVEAGHNDDDDDDDDDALSNALRAGRRMSKAPSDRQRAPGEPAPVDSISNLVGPSSSRTQSLSASGTASTPEPTDNYTAIPVVRPLTKSSSSSPRSARGLQQAWAFPRQQRDRHLSTESRATSASSGAGRGSNDATPVPLFVYGDDYENLFYRPESAPRDVANASPARPVHISYASLGASSGDTPPSSGSLLSDDDCGANETITRVSQQQVPALRSPDSVDRRDYFHSPHRRSLIPELVGASPPRAIVPASGAGAAPSLDSPDSATRSGVLHRFPRPPLPTEHAASYATTSDGRSAVYVDALSTPFDDDDGDDGAFDYDGRAGSRATTTTTRRGYDTQTQDSHYVTADDESLARFGSEAGSSDGGGHVY